VKKIFIAYEFLMILWTWDDAGFTKTVLDHTIWILDCGLKINPNSKIQNQITRDLVHPKGA
jgi:hypothetical protein